MWDTSRGTCTYSRMAPVSPIGMTRRFPRCPTASRTTPYLRDLVVIPDVDRRGNGWEWRDSVCASER